MKNSASPDNQLLILGVGNMLLCDEGVGIHAIKALATDPDIPSCVHIADGGTTGMALMGLVQQYQHVIIIDAAAPHKLPPGSVRHFHPDIRHWLPSAITVHELGLNELFSALILNGHCPDIHMIVVTALRFSTVGLTLSPPVAAALPRVVSHTKHLIASILNQDY